MDSDWRQLRDKVESCINEGRYLTKPEIGFLESLSEKIELGESLTPRERERLHDIWQQKVP